MYDPAWVNYSVYHWCCCKWASCFINGWFVHSIKFSKAHSETEVTWNVLKISTNGTSKMENLNSDRYDSSVETCIELSSSSWNFQISWNRFSSYLSKLIERKKKRGIRANLPILEHLCTILDYFQRFWDDCYHSTVSNSEKIKFCIIGLIV